MSELLRHGVCGIGVHAPTRAVYSPASRQQAHRALAEPDVAGIILRAQPKQRRAHESGRTATDIVRMSVLSQRRLFARQLQTRLEERG